MARAAGHNNTENGYNLRIINWSLFAGLLNFDAILRDSAKTTV